MFVSRLLSRCLLETTVTKSEGDWLSDTKAGSELYIDANQVRVVKNNAELAKILASAVTEISYGQAVPGGVGTAVAVGVFTLGSGALTALSKSQKNLVGLAWANDEKSGLAVQCASWLDWKAFLERKP